MKTKNNVQKTITKSLAVISSLVLLSFTVNAQDFWKSVLKNNSFTQIAMAMTDGNPGPSHYKTSNTLSSAFINELLSTKAEPELRLESWMTNEFLFTGVSGMLQTEVEPALELEEWMMNETSFGIRTFVIGEEKDAALQPEGWMVDNKVWKM